MGSLMGQKSFEPFATPKGRQSKMYVICSIMAIVMTAIFANVRMHLYAASKSSFVIECVGVVL